MGGDPMKQQAGFTLIEALAATALAAIMMTAVMSVVSAMARSDRANGTSPELIDWRSQVIDVISRDLRHADTYQSDVDGITLSGHVALDKHTLKPAHRPAVVNYVIEEYADQKWLLRTQTDPDDRSLRNSWTQAVCSGVLSVSIASEVRTVQAQAALPESELSGEVFTVDTQGVTSTSMPMDKATVIIEWIDESIGRTTVTILTR